MTRMFLGKFLRYLKKCFNKNSLVIPHDITEEETILRVLFRPLFFSLSKKKLHFNSFLPSSKAIDIIQRSRVSVFRRDYSSDDNCKNSALSITINGQEYVGFLSFLAKHLSVTNDLPGMPVRAVLIYTPMDENNKYREVINKKFLITDRGFPMHAEIEYSKPLELDNPNTGHRMYADAMVKLVGHSYHLDKFPNDKNWRQEPISFIKMA